MNIVKLGLAKILYRVNNLFCTQLRVLEKIKYTFYILIQ